MNKYVVTCWYTFFTTWSKHHFVFTSFDNAVEFVNRWKDKPNFRFVSIECI